MIGDKSAIGIIEVFFEKSGYPDELREMLSPHILVSLLTGFQDLYKKDLDLLLLCRARLKFIRILLTSHKFFNSFENEETAEKIRGRLKDLKRRVEKQIDEILSVGEESFVNEMIFISKAIGLNEENRNLFINRNFHLVDLLETQPEIMFFI
jgi:hypothetical protein